MKYERNVIISIGAALVYRITDKIEVLLLQRNKRPYKGYFAFPGGKMELGETLLEGTLRELNEESGITEELVISTEFYGLLNEMYVDQGQLDTQFMLSYFAVEVSHDAVIRSGKEGELKWFPIDELPKNFVPSDKEMLHIYFDDIHQLPLLIEGTLENVSSDDIEVLEMTSWLIQN